MTSTWTCSTVYPLPDACASPPDGIAAAAAAAVTQAARAAARNLLTVTSLVGQLGLPTGVPVRWTAYPV
jgi:hypothetical protein